MEDNLIRQNHIQNVHLGCGRTGDAHIEDSVGPKFPQDNAGAGCGVYLADAAADQNYLLPIDFAGITVVP